MLVGQGGNTVDLVDLRSGTSTVGHGHGAISRNQVFVYVAIVAQQHALSDLVDTASNGSTLGMEQGPIESTLGEQYASVGTVKVIVVKVLHHEKGSPILLLRWQQ